MGNAGWNLLGSRGAEIFASGLGGGFESELNGNGFWEGFAQGAALGLASSVLTGLIISPDFEYDGRILEAADLQKGDIVGWGGLMGLLCQEASSLQPEKTFPMWESWMNILMDCFSAKLQAKENRIKRR